MDKLPECFGKVHPSAVRGNKKCYTCSVYTNCPTKYEVNRRQEEQSHYTQAPDTDHLRQINEKLTKLIRLITPRIVMDPSKISPELMKQIATSKPGQIIPMTKKQFEGIHQFPIPKKENLSMSIIYQATCAECGTEINVSDVELDRIDDLHIKVEPCEECLEDAREIATEIGREIGRDEAQED